MENHVGTLVLNRMNSYSDKIMMRVKRNNIWENFSGSDVSKMLEKVAYALLLEGIVHQENIGIYSQNMPEWTFSDVGALLIGAVPVPIYATNVSNQLKYILQDAQINTLFVGEQQQYDETLKIIDDDDVSIKKVIVFEKEVKLTHSKSIYFSDWIDQDFSSVVSEYKTRKENFKTDDLCTIIYTSGTTGEPKGVMLGHDNVLNSCSNHDIKFNLSDDNDSLCFLPLSHVFERIWTYYIFHKGMLNTYMKDPKDIADTLLEVSPTVLCSVPRLYEKIYDMAYTKLKEASKLKQTLFNWSLKIGKQVETNKVNDIKSSYITNIKYKLADKLVLSKIRNKMGGNLKFMPCGGAFLTNNITEFFRAAGLPIIIGYGLTETVATVTAYDVQNYRLGTVGETMPNTEIKIGENDEILVRSKSVMKGYYNKPEETAAVFDGDWFKTGDAGKFDESGHLIITDRIKDLMKTSGGKYIAPQHVESTLRKDNFIEQVIVIGEGKPFVTALLTPNFEALKLWATNSGLTFENCQDLISHSKVVTKFQEILNEVQGNLAKYEKVKKFKLMAREFTIEHGEMTPTFKLKRKIITQKYDALIQEMYNKILKVNS